MSCSTESFIKSEISSYHHGLKEDSNIDEEVLKNSQKAKISSDVGELTDEDNIDDTDFEEETVNEFSEINQENSNDKERVFVTQVKHEIQIAIPKKEKIDNFEETIEETKRDMTKIKNLKSHTVEEIFELLFSEDMFKDIIDHSIEYAKQNNNNGFTLTINELKIFIGIFLLTGYHKEPQEKMYWESLPDTGLPIVYNAMNRERYREIKKYLQLCDNSNLDKNDTFSKLRPYINKLENNYLQFEAENNCSIGAVDLNDKQVSQYKTHIGYKKLWLPVFTQYLDATVVNAWRLYQEVSHDKNMPLLNARRKIVLSYLSKPSSANRKRTARKRSITEKRVSKAIRLDAGNHFVQPIPTQRRCANCGKKAKRLCTRCQVPLHDKCFQEFHSSDIN